MIPQNFKSVTIWQGEPEWEIKVTVGGFNTSQAADDFGCNQAKRLIHSKEASNLGLVDSSGNCHKIEQEQIVVRKIKPESRYKLFVSDDDFVVVDVKIEQFSITEGLNRGFGSLSYGVTT